MTDLEWAINEDGKIDMALFALDKETKRRVLNVISNYYGDEEDDEEITDEDFYAASTQRYGSVSTSPTNNVTKITETRAIEIQEKRKRIDEASFRNEAIKAGIRRAAGMSCYTADQEQLYDDMFQHLVNNKARDEFTRSTGTITRYRKMALFFIAEELGLVKRGIGHSQDDK